jgi:hypothetical protein
VAILRGVGARFAAAAVAAWLLVCAPLLAEQRTATAEDDIKATFLFNFTKYVTWPALDAGEPFRLCVVAEPAFGSAVDRIIEGETIDGHPLLRVTPETPDAAPACRILFIGRLESERGARWLSAVRDAPVLVVGESKQMWDRGAHINFIVDDNRVKFDVNVDTASAAKLPISAKLLRVAHQVTARKGS